MKVFYNLLHEKFQKRISLSFPRNIWNYPFEQKVSRHIQKHVESRILLKHKTIMLNGKELKLQSFLYKAEQFHQKILRPYL
jgi:hypothetical protein